MKEQLKQALLSVWHFTKAVLKFIIDKVIFLLQHLDTLLGE